MAYSLETILAEKYETIIRRNIGTTRARDFYDLYILFRTRKDEIRREVLKLAVEHTAEKRGSQSLLVQYEEICKELRDEQALHELWKNYIADNPYASHLQYDDMIENVLEVGRYIK